MIDVEAVRADTPATRDLIHLNNAGSSLPPRPVVDTVKAHLDLEAAAGGYEAANQSGAQDQRFYDAASRLLNCARSEVAFTVSASDAWWRAFLSIPLQPGDRILAGHSEYVANAFGLIQARERGIEVDLIPNDEFGQIDTVALADALDDRVKLVCLTHVPTSSGLVNPAAEVGVMAKEVGAWYLLDACQSAGQLPLDVDELRCDFLSLTGRKFLRGPRGTGLLYARRDRLDELVPGPFIDGRSARWTSAWEYVLAPSAQRFELFEVSYAAKFGFAVALDYALDIGLDAIEERVVALATRLRDGLASVPGITVHDLGRQLCGIVTFTVRGRSAADVGTFLGGHGVNVSKSSAEMAQFDLAMRQIPEVVRASVHYFNTEDEIDRVLELLTT